FDIYLNKLKTINVNSIHFGGGTPNFLGGETLLHLINYFTQQSSVECDISIEVDPRRSDAILFDFLNDHRVKHISLGIQDFNQDVQKNINRVQPYKLVKEFLQQIHRKNKIINFDLIYGLPGQNLATIKETIAGVRQLRPEHLAI